jgi:hypothetical protein
VISPSLACPWRSPPIRESGRRTLDEEAQAAPVISKCGPLTHRAPGRAQWMANKEGNKTKQGLDPKAVLIDWWNILGQHPTLMTDLQAARSRIIQQLDEWNAYSHPENSTISAEEILRRFDVPMGYLLEPAVPDARCLPLMQSSPTRHAAPTPQLLRQVFPLDARLEYEDDARQGRPVRYSRAATVRIRRRHQLPQSLSYQLLCHATSVPLTFC